MKNDIELLAFLKVNKYDRDYQIWEREPLSIELLNKAMFIQKLEYIHYNLPVGKAGPVRAGLCELSEDYHYSSARFYHDGTNGFEMLNIFPAAKFGFIIPPVRKSAILVAVYVALRVGY